MKTSTCDRKRQNLAQALKESQKLKSRSLEEITSELNSYRWYCDKAASHMATAEKSAPGAVKLMRKCTPIIEENIQATIAEIQKKAREICEITRDSGTVYEAPVTEINKAARTISLDDICRTERNLSRITSQLKEICSLLPKGMRERVCGALEEVEMARELPDKLDKIELAIAYVGPAVETALQSGDLGQDIKQIDNKVPVEHKFEQQGQSVTGPQINIGGDVRGSIFPHIEVQGDFIYNEATKMPLQLADVVILTVLPEEYGCIRDRLSELGLPPNMDSVPNLYAWKFGKVSCQNLKADYKIAVGMIGRAGTTEGALAAREAVQLWRPRYVLFCGIAGGLPDPKERNSHPKLGDVVVADIIYGYEYGKLEREFKPRANWTYRTDQALLNGARAYAISDGWRELIKAEPPRECAPKVISGEIASGDQVVDDPTNDFFAQVLKMWPKINAVEMEGAGAAAAIEQAGSQGIPTRFMMIRGISDLPRAKGKNKGRKERDDWKAYASDAAAAFVMGWIAEGLPMPPSDKRASL